MQPWSDELMILSTDTIINYRKQHYKGSFAMQDSKNGQCQNVLIKASKIAYLLNCKYTRIALALTTIYQ